MSARVLNPIMMGEMSRSGHTGGRIMPTKAELAPVRRDLFGPVDHAAARALAERELRAQANLDAERWGFDFQLELPRCDDARYLWEVVTPVDVVPEPYALRGMPYLRKHAPGTPRKTSRTLGSSTTTTKTRTRRNSGDVDDDCGSNVMNVTATPRKSKSKSTPLHELRVPEIGIPVGETTPEEVPITGNTTKQSPQEPTTPVLPPSARKQSSITDFMKSRKRPLKGSTKTIMEPPEKMSRSAGHIRS